MPFSYDIHYDDGDKQQGVKEKWVKAAAEAKDAAREAFVTQLCNMGFDGERAGKMYDSGERDIERAVGKLLE